MWVASGEPITCHHSSNNCDVQGSALASGHVYLSLGVAAIHRVCYIFWSSRLIVSFIPPSHNLKSPPGLSTFVYHIKDKPYWLFPPREARILMFRYKSLDVRVHAFYFSKENSIFPLTFLGKIHFLSFKRTLRSKVCVLHN